MRRGVAGLPAHHRDPFDRLLLRALSARATGTVRLAEGDARAALGELRQSEAIWQELEASHEAARTRVLVARLRRAWRRIPGEMSLRGAAAVFEQLSAVSDRTLVEELRARTLVVRRMPGPLVPRPARS